MTESSYPLSRHMGQDNNDFEVLQSAKEISSKFIFKKDDVINHNDNQEIENDDSLPYLFDHYDAQNDAK